MSGASIGTTLELWASALRDLKSPMRPLFTQKRVAASAGLFLDGLLGTEQRKTGWMRAETAGDPGTWGLSRERIQQEARLREVARGLSDRDLGLALTLAEAMTGR